MSMIICGFSGIGKSTAAQKNRKILDFESSGYSNIFENGLVVSRNKDFPENYIDKLEELIRKDVAHYYLLSCDEQVRNELKARGLKYMIILPYRDYENEYIKRWVRQGRDIDFITKMSERWDAMIDSCALDTVPKIYLDEHEYLSDILIG